MKEFTLNGKKYDAIRITFNDVCDLQDMGVDLTKITKLNALPTMRAIISLAFGKDRELAGQEIEQHIINGGSIEDLTEIVKDAVEDSGFFKALNKK